MAQTTLGVEHNSHSVGFGQLDVLTFPAVTLSINQTNSTVQAALAVPTHFKVYRVNALMTGSPAGTCSINVVSGTAAEGSQGTPDTYDKDGSITLASAGNIVLSSDTAVTMTANTVTQVNVDAPHFDVIYGSGSVLTLRTVTNGSAAGTLTVQLLGKYVCYPATKPINSAFDATVIP